MSSSLLNITRITVIDLVQSVADRTSKNRFLLQSLDRCWDDVRIGYTFWILRQTSSKACRLLTEMSRILCRGLRLVGALGGRRLRVPRRVGLLSLSSRRHIRYNLVLVVGHSF
jgi:hypothetical protein